MRQHPLDPSLVVVCNQAPLFCQPCSQISEDDGLLPEAFLTGELRLVLAPEVLGGLCNGSADACLAQLQQPLDELTTDVAVVGVDELVDFAASRTVLGEQLAWWYADFEDTGQLRVGIQTTGDQLGVHGLIGGYDDWQRPRLGVTLLSVAVHAGLVPALTHPVREVAHLFVVHHGHFVDGHGHVGVQTHATEQ